MVYRSAISGLFPLQSLANSGYLQFIGEMQDTVLLIGRCWLRSLSSGFDASPKTAIGYQKRVNGSLRISQKLLLGEIINEGRKNIYGITIFLIVSPFKVCTSSPSKEACLAKQVQTRCHHWTNISQKLSYFLVWPVLKNRPEITDLSSFGALRCENNHASL